MNAQKPPVSAVPDVLPLSSLYRQWAVGTTGRVQEPERPLETFTERHLHCVWVDPRLRPSPLESARGEEVRILHPGDWNHGSGPDFRDAEWTVGGRRFHGDVEIHIHPMDWVHHGHRGDPRYREVRLHVTYYPGELPLGHLPEGCAEVSLKEALDRRSHFFFETIDLSAYPWDREGTQSGLRTWFAAQEETECGRMLEAAGQERLRRKTQRMLGLIRAVGPEQALYQCVLRGLGYDRNADPAERLAVRLPVSLLQHYAQGDPVRGYACLTGCGGLLPHEETSTGFTDWFSLRRLWDDWWRVRDVLSTEEEHRTLWRLDRCRPGNHPARRLWAACHWFLGNMNPATDWRPAAEEPDSHWFRRVNRELQVPAPDPASGESQVVGPQRAAALMINAVLPWRLALCPCPPEPGWTDHLPSEPFNHKARKAFHTFLGPDAHPRLCRGTLRRQGLLQLAEDYGL